MEGATSTEALQIGAVTEIGGERTHNEDKHEHVSCSRGDLLIVCDGMGGHAAGDVASAIATRAVAAALFDLDCEDPRELLYRALEAAHEQVAAAALAAPDKEGMGTTCVAVLVKDGLAYTGNVGDSRAYHLRGDEITQLSVDHTKVRRLVAQELISPEEALTHPEAGVLSQAIGQDGAIQPYVREEPTELQPGDVLLLCSDGAYDFLDSDGELLEILREPEVEQAARALVQRALERDGNDNATAVVARVPSAPDTVVEAEPPAGPSGARSTVLEQEPEVRPSKPGARLPSLVLMLALGAIGGVLLGAYLVHWFRWLNLAKWW